MSNIENRKDSETPLQTFQHHECEEEKERKVGWQENCKWEYRNKSKLEELQQFVLAL